jgi:hypothetical protein
MAGFQIIGNKMVDFEEWESLEPQKVESFYKAVAEKKEMSILTRSGTLNSLDVRDAFAKDPIPSQPIGLGKPLSVEIFGIYNGDHPNVFLGGKKRDTILVSGVTNPLQTSSSARAVNLIKENAKERKYLERSAWDAGTSLVYYSPAMDRSKCTISLELKTDNFEQDIVDAIATVLKDASGYPIFLTAAPFLYAGSRVLGSLGNIANSILEKKKNLEDSIVIQFRTASIPPSIARRVLFCNQNDKRIFRNYDIQTLDNDGDYIVRLVHKNDGQVYNGKAPYIIANLDGAVKKEYEAFVPLIATSSQVDKFFGGQVTESVMKIFQDSMSLANDMAYLNKIKDAMEDIESLEEGSPEYEDLKVLIESFKKNIGNSDIKSLVSDLK